VKQKAKSDNKYFAAMRDRDAIDTERKNLQATFAKQNQVLDHIRGLNKVIQENHVSNDSPKKKLRGADVGDRTFANKRIWC